MVGSLEVTGHINGQTVGYARVSSVDQNLQRQIETLGRLDRLFSEKISGSVTNRPEMEAMITYIRDGDTVRVVSPDRLARSTTDLLAIAKRIKDKGASLEFVDNPSLNTDTAQGEFMLTILGAVAQLERAVIRERQMEGIAIAKRSGKYDRQPKLSPEQVDTAKQQIQLGIPKTTVAKNLGCSRQTLYDALEGKGSYAP